MSIPPLVERAISVHSPPTELGRLLPPFTVEAVSYTHLISAVLPELGVDQVHQWTFPQLCARLLGKDMPRLQTEDPLFTLLDPAAPQAQKQDLALAARLRGTLAFRDAIVRYLEQVERSLPPQKGFTLEGQTVLSGEALRQLYLQDLKPFPLKRRMEELKKPLRRRVSEMLGALIAAREERAAAMALLLRRTSPEDSPQRRAAMQRIYAQRDQAVAALREQIRAYPAQAAAALTPPKVLDAYIALLYGPVPQGIDPQAWAALTRVALPALQVGRAAEEDLPALVLIRRKLYGPVSYTHLDVYKRQITPCACSGVRMELTATTGTFTAACTRDAPYTNQLYPNSSGTDSGTGPSPADTLK